MPGVLDAAVIGIKDPRAGEVPKAFIVKSPKHDIDQQAVNAYLEGKVWISQYIHTYYAFIQCNCNFIFSGSAVQEARWRCVFYKQHPTKFVWKDTEKRIESPRRIGIALVINLALCYFQNYIKIDLM